MHVLSGIIRHPFALGLDEMPFQDAFEKRAVLITLISILTDNLSSEVFLAGSMAWKRRASLAGAIPRPPRVKVCSG